MNANENSDKRRENINLFKKFHIEFKMHPTTLNGRAVPGQTGGTSALPKTPSAVDVEASRLGTGILSQTLQNSSSNTLLSTLPNTDRVIIRSHD